MRIATFLSATMCGLVLVGAGCSGPSHKLGRGFNNMTEFVRMGDLRRSMEQTAIWENPDVAYSAGFIQGFNRSVMRTFIGVSEVVTFAIPTPTYDAWYLPKNRGVPDVYMGGPLRNDQTFSLNFMTVNPVYPQNYAPGILADSIFATDTSLGFSGGDIAPFIPGSRFHIFDH